MSDSNPSARIGAPGQQSSVPAHGYGGQPPDLPSFAPSGPNQPSAQPGSQTYQSYPAAQSPTPLYQQAPAGQPGVAPTEQWSPGQPYQQSPGGQPFASTDQQWPAGQQGFVPVPAQSGESATGPEQAPATRKRSALAIVSFVIGLVVVAISLFSGIVVMALAPILLGVLALQDIKRKGKRGKGLAIAGIVLGGISTVLYVINIAVG